MAKPAGAPGGGAGCPLYWRGKGLGGSSTMNGQIAIRGVSDALTNGPRWLHRLVGPRVMPLFSMIEDDLSLATGGPWSRRAAADLSRATGEMGPLRSGLRDAALAAVIHGVPT